METIESKKKQGFKYLLIVLAGLIILLYPWLSNTWNEFRNSKLISVYDAAIQEGSIDVNEELEKAREYNRNLRPKVVPDAFSAKDGQVDKEYESILNICNDGIIGSLEVPCIDIKVPIYHYSTESSLQKGLGHLLGSSLPVGGKGTHAVISGHRGLPSAELFTNLNLVKKGDSFYISILGEKMRYEVDQILTVLPDETESLAVDPKKDYVTLVTCTPYGVNTHRLLVRGHRVPLGDEDDVATRSDLTRLLIEAACFIAGIGLAILGMFIYDRIAKKREESEGEPEDDFDDEIDEEDEDEKETE